MLRCYLIIIHLVRKAYELSLYGKLGEVLNKIKNISLNPTDTENYIDVFNYWIALILQDYWKFVEKGRLPGSFPNIGQLQQWIQIKQILPRPMANGNYQLKNN